MELRATIVLAALTLGACAGGRSGAGPDADPFLTLKFADAKPAGSPEPPSSDAEQVEAFQIEVSVESERGARLAAPKIVSLPGMKAAIGLGTPVTCVVDYDTHIHSGETPTPITKAIDDGLHFEACARRAADGGITLGFRIHLSKLKQPIEELQTTLANGPPVTIQIPDVTTVEACGVRWIEAGAEGMLARLTSPDGSGPMLVLARVTPTTVDAPPPGVMAAASSDDAIAQPMTGHTSHLRVTVVRVARDFEPGTVIDETATPDVMKAIGGQVLRDFEEYSCLDPRVRIAEVRGDGGKFHAPDKPAPVAWQLVAEMKDDGLLHVTWNGRTAAVRPNTGRRFVAIAPVEGGGTAGAMVSLDADE